MGSWVVYGLGSMTQDLPAFVAIPDLRGNPPNGPANWNSGFLPAAYQATAFNTERPIADLQPPREPGARGEQDVREFLHLLNERHLRRNPGEGDLTARVATYELAARMQLSAPEVTDLSKESRATLQQYRADSDN